MRICVFGNVRIRARWIGPYALRNVRWEFRDWMWIFCRVFAILFQSVSNVISRPLAAVGADLSCPHIRIYPQNDEQKCVCDETNTRIWWCENTDLAKEKYGHDESVPYAWRCVSWVFWGVRWYFAGCKLGVFVGERGYSRNVCNVFILCMLHVRKTKAWFLACKSMVFGLQKGGFCIAKVWFLFFECYVVANWSHAFRGWMWIFCGVFAILFQFANSVISRPLAAVGDRFIVPSYP